MSFRTAGDGFRVAGDGGAGGGGLDLTSGGTIGGNLVVNGTLNVTGATDLDSSLNVDGNAQVDGTLAVDGNITSNARLRTKHYADVPYAAGVFGATTQFDPANGGYQRFDTGGTSPTSTAGPIILPGTVDGQVLVLENDGSAGALTLTDLATDTDSGVITVSGSVAIGAKDVTQWVWSVAQNAWIQTGLSNN
jgi:hypothetical protein